MMSNVTRTIAILSLNLISYNAYSGKIKIVNNTQKNIFYSISSGPNRVVIYSKQSTTEPFNTPYPNFTIYFKGNDPICSKRPGTGTQNPINKASSYLCSLSQAAPWILSINKISRLRFL